MSRAGNPRHREIAMSGHTPGPWYAMVAETGGMSDQANVFSEYETDGEPTFIADTLPIDDEVPLKQRRANAFLIAAGPELLEMAKLFEKSVEYQIRVARTDARSDEEGARLMTITLNLVRDAIAKAERGTR
jgi:hypothetical protein